MFLRFIFYIARISDQRGLGVYSQSNVLVKMLPLHSDQPWPQDYCTNNQYNPQDRNIGTDWDDIIYDV